MIESFVDLAYRGLPLGRRVKLTQVQPASGYLEMPAPMPVGTTIAVTTDEGVTIEARVLAIHEQVGGAELPPGMTVAPVLTDEGAAAWWKAREVEPPPPAAPATPRREQPITVRPRSRTIPAPPPDGALADAAQTAQRAPAAAPEPPGGKTIVMPAVTVDDMVAAAPASVPPVSVAREADAGRTKVMAAVDQELLESLTRKNGELDALRTSDHAVVDDGRQTTVMAAIDPAALGLDVTSSGSMPTMTDDDDDGSSDDASPDETPDPAPAPTTGRKRKRKRKS